MYINIKKILRTLLCCSALSITCAQAMNPVQPLFKNRRDFDASNDANKVKATALHVADKALEICNSVPKDYAPREIACLKAPWEQRKEALNQATNPQVIISTSCGLVWQLGEDLESIRTYFVKLVESSRQEKEIVPGWRALSQQILDMWPKDADVIALCTDEHDVLTRAQQYMLMTNDYWKIADALFCTEAWNTTRSYIVEQEQVNCLDSICKAQEIIKYQIDGIKNISSPAERWQKITTILDCAGNIVQNTHKLAFAEGARERAYVSELVSVIKDEMATLDPYCSVTQSIRKLMWMERLKDHAQLRMQDALILVHDASVLCDELLGEAVQEACNEFSAYEIQQDIKENLDFNKKIYNEEQSRKSRCNMAKRFLDLWNNLKKVGKVTRLPIEKASTSNAQPDKPRTQPVERTFSHHVMQFARQYWYVGIPAAAGLAYVGYKLFTTHKQKKADELKA